MVKLFQGDGFDAYVKNARAAFKKVHTLKLIENNPVADMTFKTFSHVSIKGKEAKIFFKDTPVLKTIFNEAVALKSKNIVFNLTMLLHGTRVGETRKIKWAYFDFNNKILRLPATITKSKEPLYIPLTEPALAMFKKYRTKHYSNDEYLFGKLTGRRT